MKVPRNSVFIVFTGFLISITRLIIGKIENIPDEIILHVMALINYIAFGFVLLFLYQDIMHQYYISLQKAALMTAQKKKANIIITLLSSILSLLYFFVGLIYIIFLRSIDLNDAIAIIALAISIASSGLTEMCSPIFFKIIIKISKISFRRL
ncbi:hypothetical protein NSB25_25775 [Acetatifactor muris]|uniref:Uncharacterized protein n=1 Tax=Acetatifactor muris TaxID=879566 RepID=A0A2K4ZP57_9FIRM|nr:hypothetical protein [Acetatifactor muris]MCR2050646.1 hypothetical protein [Acetatifactor muris]SOY32196.1 hypothetical protein AMURIS_04954 [Acetatifactor muris]